MAQTLLEVRATLERSVATQEQDARHIGERIAAVEATVRRMNDSGTRWKDVKDASSAVASMDQVLTRLRTPARSNRSVDEHRF